jgi:hypothetical protein
MKKANIIEYCDECHSFKLYMPFRGAFNADASDVIAVCTKGNFVIMDRQTDTICNIPSDRCPLEDYKTT